MFDWWTSMTLTYQVFTAIGMVSLLALIIQMIMLLFGLDHGDADVSGGVDVDGLGHASGAGILSVRTVVAFMVGFGWTGVICLKGGLSIIPTLLISAAVGAVFMFVVFFLMVGFNKLKDSGNLDMGKAVGKIATAYVTIPGKRTGAGKIHVVLQSQLRELSAFTSSQDKISPGTKVKIVEIIDPTAVLVETLGNKEG